MVTANGVVFIEDSKSTLNFRNFYYNSDIRDTHKPTADEWWQAFVLNVQSGFTAGTIGLGTDAIWHLCSRSQRASTTFDVRDCHVYHLSTEEPSPLW
ncbi:OprD family outer membrane porin [Pseudomonas sp. HY7a-MNA-CIBAN-0227]|uniref:OprD family outer membrane porin n=1 Tax=Pseudomonas sp. HY7a-MNA-CIBAN-0227 TaxID=3140474 RepID=UPI003333FDD3